MPAASRNFNENDPGCVVHGSDASKVRPVYHGIVTWVGSVLPSNMLANDIWLNPNIGESMTLTELGSPPAAPAANSVILYAEDNGSGKTRLMARFPTGAPVVIVTEP
jgi:hypothetical protein